MQHLAALPILCCAGTVAFFCKTSNSNNMTYTASGQAEGGAGLPIAVAAAALISAAIQVLSSLNVI